MIYRYIRLVTPDTDFIVALSHPVCQDCTVVVT